MNSQKVDKVLGRLKKNQENLEDFRRTNLEELKAKGLFDFYLDKLSKKTVSFEETFESLTHQKYFALDFKDSSRLNEFIALEMTPEMVMIDFWDVDVEGIELKTLVSNLYHFYIKQIVNHFTSKQSPKIKLYIPDNFSEFDFKELNVKEYEIETYIYPYEKMYDGGKHYILTHKNVKEHDCATGEDVLRITQNLFGEEHTFTNNNGDKATTTKFSRGVIGFEKDRPFINQLSIVSSSSALEKIAKQLGTRIVGTSYWVPISKNKQDWEEEIEVLSSLTYEDIYQSKENLNKLSQEIMKMMKGFLEHRFHHVRYLPMTEDVMLWGETIMGDSQLHTSIVKHLTSGDWAEEDNYKSKLMNWMNSLKVVESNSFGMVLYYDGSLKGLSQTAFLLLPISNTERILKTKCSNYIFASEKEAMEVLRSKNQRLVDYWNRKI